MCQELTPKMCYYDCIASLDASEEWDYCKVVVIIAEECMFGSKQSALYCYNPSDISETIHIPWNVKLFVQYVLKYDRKSHTEVAF